MKRLLTIFSIFPVLFSFFSCEPSIPDGHFRCDPDKSRSCPSGWICQKRGTEGVYRCWSKSAGYCGNGKLDPGEECDKYAFREVSDCDPSVSTCDCPGSSMVCNPDNCTVYCAECGDKIIEGSEQCDDGNSNSGDGCSASCLVERYCTDENETASCTGWCGDGQVNGPEVCDGDNFGYYTCEFFGYYGGTLSCSDDCTEFLTHYCSGFCGDGTQNSVESCDGDRPADLSCQHFGYDDGFTTCTAFCQQRIENCYSQTRNLFSPEVISNSASVGDYNYFTSGSCLYFTNTLSTTQLSCLESGEQLTYIAAASPNDILLASSQNNIYKFNGSILYLHGYIGQGTYTGPSPICYDGEHYYFAFKNYLYRNINNITNIVYSHPDTETRFTHIACLPNGNGAILGGTSNSQNVLVKYNSAISSELTPPPGTLQKITTSDTEIFLLYMNDTYSEYSIYSLYEDQFTLYASGASTIFDIRYDKDFGLTGILDGGIRTLPSGGTPELIFPDPDAIKLLDFNKIATIDAGKKTIRIKMFHSHFIETIGLFYTSQKQSIGHGLFFLSDFWLLSDGNRVIFENLNPPFQNPAVTAESSDVVHLGGSLGTGGTIINGIYSPWTIPETLWNNQRITTLSVDPNGNLWAGGRNGTVAVRTGSTWELKTLYASGIFEILFTNQISNIVFTSGNTLFVSAGEDKCYRCPDNNSCSPCATESLNFHSIASMGNFVLISAENKITGDPALLRCTDSDCIKIMNPSQTPIRKLSWISNDLITAETTTEFFIFGPSGWQKHSELTPEVSACSVKGCITSNNLSSGFLFTHRGPTQRISPYLGQFGEIYCSSDRIIKTDDNTLPFIHQCDLDPDFFSSNYFQSWTFTSPVSGDFTVSIDGDPSDSGLLLITDFSDDNPGIPQSCDIYDEWVDNKLELSLNAVTGQKFHIIAFSSSPRQFVLKVDCL
ncbi:hypothetical protein KKF34_05815 [Myxococcota bacterium]|nr:hypothetical protein [Myxococcota bacterium]MBU1380266.1 hypothetical protein [Myxococcota bacterium]MBU1496379.1 hypothetical protein [Myxococcota bacterium]